MNRALLPLLATTLAGCGAFNQNDAKGVAAPSKYTHLVFSVVDPQYTSARLYLDKLADGTLTELASGESGDAFVATAGGKAVLFNRAAGKLNFKTLDVATAAVGAEKAPEGVDAYDPKDVLELDAHRWLVAGGSGQKLLVIDPADGHLVQTVTADWDLGTGSAFRPEKLWLRKQIGHNQVIVFTQGRGSDQYLTYDGSQHAYFLEDRGGSEGLVAIDLDEKAPKVQGLALRANPSAVVAPDASNPDILWIAGLCGAFDQGCTGAGFDRLDLATRKLEPGAWDLDPEALKLNSGLEAGRDGKVFASVVKEDQSKVVVQLDPGAKSVTTVHTYPAASTACCFIKYDDSGKTLWVGDSDAASTGGFISVYDLGSGGDPKKIDLPGIPYTGTFVAQ